MALGIYEDTGSLTYEGTTERDALALAWLLKGCKPKNYKGISQESLSKEEIDFLSKNLVALEKLFIDGSKVVVFVLRSEEYNPDFCGWCIVWRMLKMRTPFCDRFRRQ